MELAVIGMRGVNLRPKLANTYLTQVKVGPMAQAAAVENQIRILVADDHEMILDIARMYLDQQGDMSVVTVMDLDAALAAFREEGPLTLSAGLSNARYGRIRRFAKDGGTCG